MFIALTVLFIVTCYREVIAEEKNVTNATALPEISTAGSNKPNNLTGRENSMEIPTNVNSKPGSQSFDSNNATNKSDAQDHDELNNSMHISLHEHDALFFSSYFKTRLAKWKKILLNASRHCIKPNYTDILEIDFPVFGVKEDGDDGFLSLETIQPVLVRRKKKQDLVNIAYMAILELWPLLVLCFSCAALSGILVWILDTRSNPEQFPKRFWRGIFDGMWWAVVTMSTVGYGDKSPRSFLARLFAIVWMVSGIILLSMFTAQVSSRLTAQELRSDHHLFGKKIGVPPGLYKSDYVDYKMTYSVVEEIENATALDHWDLDSILIFHCDGKRKIHWEVLQLMPACEVGAMVNFQIQSPSSNDFQEIDTELDYLKCIKMQVTMARKYIQKLENKPKMHRTCNKLLEQQDNRKFEFKWVYFRDLSQYLIPFGAVVGAIFLAFFIGAIWECRKKGEKSGFEVSKPSFTLQSAATEEEPIINETSKC